MSTAEAEAVAAEPTDAPTPEVLASGNGYRAVLKRGDDVIWMCPHVHFTDHSAKNCPALRRASAGA